MKLVNLSNGKSVNLDNVASLSIVAGTSIAFTDTGGGTTTFNTPNPDLVLSQINSFTKSAEPHLTLNVAGTSTWSDISPNTGGAGVPMTFEVDGTGFLFWGYTFCKFDDGGGHSYVSTNMVVHNDTYINIAITVIVAGTYTLYFSADGSIWTNTGLTVTFS